MDFRGVVSGTEIIAPTGTFSTSLTVSGIPVNLSGGGGSGNFLADGTVPMTGQFDAADGSSEAPGISFANDQDTGFFRSSSDILEISAGGTARVTISGANATTSGLGVAGNLTANRGDFSTGLTVSGVPVPLTGGAGGVTSITASGTTLQGAVTLAGIGSTVLHTSGQTITVSGVRTGLPTMALQDRSGFLGSTLHLGYQANFTTVTGIGGPDFPTEYFSYNPTLSGISIKKPGIYRLDVMTPASIAFASANETARFDMYIFVDTNADNAVDDWVTVAFAHSRFQGNQATTMLHTSRVVQLRPTEVTFPVTFNVIVFLGAGDSTDVYAVGGGVGTNFSCIKLDGY